MLSFFVLSWPMLCIAGISPLAITSRSEGIQVAGDVYGPELSCPGFRLSTFFSAHVMVSSTAVLTVCTTFETRVAADVGFSAALSVVGDVPSVDATGGFELLRCWT